MHDFLMNTWEGAALLLIGIVAVVVVLILVAKVGSMWKATTNAGRVAVNEFRMIFGISPFSGQTSRVRARVTEELNRRLALHSEAVVQVSRALRAADPSQVDVALLVEVAARRYSELFEAQRLANLLWPESEPVLAQQQAAPARQTA